MILNRTVWYFETLLRLNNGPRTYNLDMILSCKSASLDTPFPTRSLGTHHRSGMLPLMVPRLENVQDNSLLVFRSLIHV